jgi:hypothetical protein
VNETLRLRADDMSWRAVESEIVVLDQRDSTYLAVNRAGSVLWPLLAEGATRSELAAELVERFGIDQVRAEADVDAFLEFLAGRDLLAPA